jgi:hypothetical protein
MALYEFRHRKNVLLPAWRLSADFQNSTSTSIQVGQASFAICTHVQRRAKVIGSKDTANWRCHMKPSGRLQVYGMGVPYIIRRGKAIKNYNFFHYLVYLLSPGLCPILLLFLLYAVFLSFIPSFILLLLRLISLILHFLHLRFLFRIVFSIFHLHTFSFPCLLLLLMHCATNRQVAGSIPDGVTGIFH